MTNSSGATLLPSSEQSTLLNATVVGGVVGAGVVEGGGVGAGVGAGQSRLGSATN